MTYEPEVENALVEEVAELDPVELDLVRQVESVYRSCWKEFYEWEPKYCREELRKLGDGCADLSDEGLWADIEEWEEETTPAASEAFEKIQVLLGAQLNLSEVRVRTVRIQIDFPPVPPYEFCMPITRSVPCIEQDEEELDEDISDSELADGRPGKRRVLWIKFCPFTDPDESFPTSERNRLLEGTKLYWEAQPYVDNDSTINCYLLSLSHVDKIQPLVDIIEIETISRLSHLSFDKIEDLHILPRPIYPEKEELGILARWHFR